MLQSKVINMSFPPHDEHPGPDDGQTTSENPPGPDRGQVVPAVVYTSPEVLGEPWQATDTPEPRREPWRRTRRFAWELAQTLVLAAIIFFTVRALAQNFRVEGSSMEPGLHNDQYLLVNKAIYQKINLKTLSKYIPFVHAGSSPTRYIFHGPHRGDVIVFRFPRDPTRDFIKRVIAVPGDSVEVVHGDVYVNKVKLNEPYVTNPANYDVPLQTVPAGEYFVLGDNRSNSYDSHLWGNVPEQNIIGQAMFSYWPLSDLGGAGNHHLNLGFVSIPLP